jgi:hypothetical protein
MKKVLIWAVFYHLAINVSCQPKVIPVRFLYDKHVQEVLLIKDSSVRIYDRPIIEVHRFGIKFDKAILDLKSKKIRIIGRICMYAEAKECIGLPGVSIFKGIREKSGLKDTLHFGESSSNRDKIGKGGYFDFKITIKKTESIFFFTPDFYLEEFKIGELIDNTINDSKKKK